ncbi:MAG: tRNA preQ1(34) S-adenosylmethionine ribosyltransferase-isomerase QueA [Nitrospiraceae bacterium]|nr:tRNA preQ1(34) S-adenosylmethionine ribosyltransferase-isomerase QueA [Nitrospiraceae bacterium]
MHIDDFSFALPEDLIALRPASRRDGARLLVLSEGVTEHRRFHNLPEYLREGDILLLNDTRVLPVRLTGRKETSLAETGGRLEVLLLRKVGEASPREASPREAGPGASMRTEEKCREEFWEVLYRGRYAGRLKINDELELELGETSLAETSLPETGLPVAGLSRVARVIFRGDLFEIISRCGAMPLPPYIKRKPDESDRERYQTVYCRDGGYDGGYDGGARASGVFGSVAAPTAGLHFTPELLDAIRARGVHVRYLTLHVGRGTFMPVRHRDVREHRMELEHFEIDRALVNEINEIRRAGGRKRLCAVGTTTARALEGYFSGRCRLTPGKEGNGTIAGVTDIFIYPGYRFSAVDALVTNFHLPRSTPLMLASAMAGRLALLKAYEEAVLAGYRFFSYGDAMLISDGKKCF